jgi:hypothetical protein
MTLDIAGALKTLSLLRERGFTVTWIDAEALVRFEAPAPPPDDVMAALDAYEGQIAALMKPDAFGLSGVDYHKAYETRLEERLASGVDRADARAEAFRHALNLWLETEFDFTARFASPWSCAYCARSEGVSVLLPIGWGNSHHWVHDHCYEAWRSARRAKAVEALTAYGIVALSRDEPGSAPLVQVRARAGCKMETNEEGQK